MNPVNITDVEHLIRQNKNEVQMFSFAWSWLYAKLQRKSQFHLIRLHAWEDLVYLINYVNSTQKYLNDARGNLIDVYFTKQVYLCFLGDIILVFLNANIKVYNG